MIWQPSLVYIPTGEPNNFTGVTDTGSDSGTSPQPDPADSVSLGAAHADRRIIVAEGGRFSGSLDTFDASLNSIDARTNGEFHAAAQHLTIGADSQLSFSVWNEASGTSQDLQFSWTNQAVDIVGFHYAVFRAVMSSGVPTDVSTGTGTGDVTLDIPGPGFAIIVNRADGTNSMSISNVDALAVDAGGCAIGYWENQTESTVERTFVCSGGGAGNIRRGYAWSLA